MRVGKLVGLPHSMLGIHVCANESYETWLEIKNIRDYEVRYTID